MKTVEYTGKTGKEVTLLMTTMMATEEKIWVNGSLLCREGKQAIITRQTDKQSIKLEEGAKYVAKKYLPHP